MTAPNTDPEEHPLEPFLPEGAKVLMLGSFPPPRERWSMEFFYPNLQNDMWRIFGVVFFDDKEYFLTKPAVGVTGKAAEKPLFSPERIKEFLIKKVSHSATPLAQPSAPKAMHRINSLRSLKR